MKNLESLIAETSYRLVEKGVVDKNTIDKLLRVLVNDGLYAFWVYMKSKGIDQKFKQGAKEVLNLLGKEKADTENLEKFFKEVTKDIDKIFFARQVLEKLLIYARYHLKAKENEASKQ